MHIVPFQYKSYYINCSEAEFKSSLRSRTFNEEHENPGIPIQNDKKLIYRNEYDNIFFLKETLWKRYDTARTVLFIKTKNQGVQIKTISFIGGLGLIQEALVFLVLIGSLFLVFRDNSKWYLVIIGILFYLLLMRNFSSIIKKQERLINEIIDELKCKTNL